MSEQEEDKSMQEENQKNASDDLVALNRHRQLADVEKARADLEAAEEEWASVQTVVPVIQREDKTASPGNEDAHEDTAVIATPFIGFPETLRYFQEADLSQYVKHIHPTMERHGLSAILNFLFGPPRLLRDLQQERNLLFSIAQCHFINTEDVHMSVLQTIYKQLTGNKLNCARYGSHWEQIGFQGSDPSTDLRGVGFLGLFQALYFVMTAETLPLARDIYKLSLDEVQNFPFLVLSINITRIALQALREGCLNKECNMQREVVDVFNQFYAAVFNHIYKIWKTKHKTIQDSGFVIKDAETFCKKNVKLTLKNLKAQLDSYSVTEKEAAKEATSTQAHLKNGQRGVLI